MPASHAHAASISVVIPCLNAEATILTAVSSAQSQFESNIDMDIICIDDGSTDSTHDLLSELAAQGLITLLQHATKCGASAARNSGLRAASGEYIQFLDADDVLLPGKLQRQMTLLSESGANFVAGAYEIRHLDGQCSTVYPETDLWAGLISSKLGKTSSNLFRSKSLHEVGGWAEGQKSSQEYELMFRLLQHRGPDGARVALDRSVGTRIISTAGSISNRDSASNALRFIRLRRKMIGYLRHENLLTDYRKCCYETAYQLSLRDLSEQTRERLVGHHMTSLNTRKKRSREKGAMAKPIYLVDRSQSEDVQSGLERLCSILRESDIHAEWCNHAGDAAPGAILLLHDPVQEEHIPDGCQVLGQRTLNRRERLVLAEKCGLSVPSWSSLESQVEIPDLMDKWNVDHLLYKADWSYSRKGIHVVNRDNVPTLGRFNADADIFMRIISGNHHTFKVDVFFDRIIGCRHLLTRSILFDKRFHRSFSGASRLGDIPPMENEMRALGHAVMQHGVGLCGIDVMFDGNAKPWVIELNTSSVGREATWRHWPDTYITGYAEAIIHWVREGCRAQYCNGISSTASILSARAGGVDATQDA